MKKGLLALVTCTLLLSVYAIIQYLKTNTTFEKLEHDFTTESKALTDAFVLPTKSMIRNRLEFLFQSKSELTRLRPGLLKEENQDEYSKLMEDIITQIGAIRSIPYQTDFYMLNPLYLNSADKRSILIKMKSFYPTAKDLLKIENELELKRLIAAHKALYQLVKKDKAASEHPILLRQVLVLIKDFIGFLKSEKIVLNS